MQYKWFMLINPTIFARKIIAKVHRVLVAGKFTKIENFFSSKISDFLKRCSKIILVQPLLYIYLSATLPLKLFCEPVPLNFFSETVSLNGNRCSKFTLV